MDASRFTEFSLMVNPPTVESFLANQLEGNNQLQEALQSLPPEVSEKVRTVLLRGASQAVKSHISCASVTEYNQRLAQDPIKLDDLIRFHFVGKCEIAQTIQAKYGPSPRTSWPHIWQYVIGVQIQILEKAGLELNTSQFETLTALRGLQQSAKER